MVKLGIEKNATADLVALQGTDPAMARRLVAIIQAINEDQNLIDTLTTNHNCLNAFEVKKWIEQYRNGKNLWFIKPWKDNDGVPPHLPYRIIYSFTPATNGKKIALTILAIVHRDFEYEPNHPITLRILRDYANNC